jgi:hypothetical protein
MSRCSLDMIYFESHWHTHQLALAMVTTRLAGACGRCNTVWHVCLHHSQDECEADLAEAMPMLEAALKVNEEEGPIAAKFSSLCFVLQQPTLALIPG